MPGIWLSCLVITFSARSLKTVSGRTSDFKINTKIGISAGLTFCHLGRDGISLGSCPETLLMANCTSCAATSTFRFKSNCIVTVARPAVPDEIMLVMPEMPANGSNKNKNQRFFHKSPRFLIKENVARLSEIYLKFCGKTTVNVVPAPIVLSARIVPLCRLTIVSAKESPSPSPFS